MKTKWKVLITVVAVLLLAIGVYASTVYSKRGVVTVQTGQRGARRSGQPGDRFRRDQA